MLMSFTIRSMAARMFCCVSARCVTSMAESIPVLNRLAIAPITSNPTAMATSSSISVKPRPRLWFRHLHDFRQYFFVNSFRPHSAEGRDQRVHLVTARRIVDAPVK